MPTPNEPRVADPAEFDNKSFRQDQDKKPAETQSTESSKNSIPETFDLSDIEILSVGTDRKSVV